jgi:hypothetical protein
VDQALISNKPHSRQLTYQVRHCYQFFCSFPNEFGRLVGYINKLENCDAAKIDKIATGHGLYEALTIYIMYDHHAIFS